MRRWRTAAGDSELLLLCTTATAPPQLCTIAPRGAVATRSRVARARQFRVPEGFRGEQD
jgi:hypothetical protein